MCKFASPNAPGYRAVSTDIRQWVDEAPALINVRWEVEEQEKAFRMRQELHERMSPFVRLITPPPLVPGTTLSSALPTEGIKKLILIGLPVIAIHNKLAPPPLERLVQHLIAVPLDPGVGCSSIPRHGPRDAGLSYRYCWGTGPAP